MQNRCFGRRVQKFEALQVAGMKYEYETHTPKIYFFDLGGIYKHQGEPESFHSSREFSPMKEDIRDAIVETMALENENIDSIILDFLVAPINFNKELSIRAQRERDLGKAAVDFLDALKSDKS